MQRSMSSLEILVLALISVHVGACNHRVSLLFLVAWCNKCGVLSATSITVIVIML